MWHFTCAALLLVGACLYATHASHLEQPHETVLDSKNNLNKIVSAGRSASVVQDWSLVCTYQCSATHLGVPCRCLCDSTDIIIPRRYQNKTYPNNKIIINTNLLENCGKTACAKSFDLAKLAALPNLTSSAQIWSAMNALYGNSVCSALYPKQQLHQQPLDDCAACFYKGLLNRQQPDTIKPMELQEFMLVDETSPDWNEMCASLCKTGDGGSLCNCNLSPFFI